MNICTLSGRIVKNATVRGTEPKALSFVIETVTVYNGDEKKDLVNCVLFNPSNRLETQLTKNGENLFVELEGRVSSSSLKTNGERRFNTDVIVRHWTLMIVNK
jgi:hypothetical protein